MYLLSIILLIPLFLYCFKVIGWCIQWVKTDDFRGFGNAEISLSLIIPFKDEAHNLRQLIESLSAQTFHQWELILVNDNSIDDSVALAKELLKNSSLDAQIINADKQGKKAALVQGAKLAKYSIIVTSDADCTFHPDWLKTLSSFYSSKEVDLTIAPVTIKRTKGFLNRFQQIDFAALQLSGASAALQGNAIMCNGANLMCSKELYLKAQLQPQIASGDDMFLLEWMKSQCKKIAFLKSKHVIVETEPAKSFKAFLHQRARWAAKAPRYSDKGIIFTGLIVSSLNLMLALSLVGALWLTFLWQIFGIAIMVKSLSDYMLLKAGSKDLNFKISLLEVIGFQLIYPFYVLSVIVFPVFSKVQWKSRNI
jgi:cellulose synthase/poly-beta-1,6-N-acetylglucosamine synthase-like glycosyltransferase